ncbi:hypothetical protein TRFO_11351 [Tritrichomonas foetus]|uniref:Uncharacterized protein n=1 Tax=Tritrichomonas foetus TaxID=1144522 RepID=A0A1J4JA11_9EUKA|nr:hypothetical protein TRFO_11351 [Tritrichomonas foetus]|eukprot:OHS94092.1 hypothetical protein TRFO_11351 [Tritrichomonas foetus]
MQSLRKIHKIYNFLRDFRCGNFNFNKNNRKSPPMPTYILDLVIRRVQVMPACPRLIRPVWLMVRSDGVTQAFTTAQAAPAETIQWDAPARLILNVPNIAEAYLQISLCTLNESYNQTQVVALSQVNLKALPAGSPKSISIPLMSCFNTLDTAAITTMTATISQLGPSPNEQRKSPFIVTPIQNPIQVDSANFDYSYNNQFNNSQMRPPNIQQYQQNNFQQRQAPMQPNNYDNQFHYNNSQNMPPQRQPPPQQNQGQQPTQPPVNPYRIGDNQAFDHPQQQQQKAKKVIYPPINPPETSILYKVDNLTNGPINQNQGPKVVRTKKSKKFWGH